LARSLDELEVGATTAQLSLADCRRLYPIVRQASTSTAREMVWWKKD
jgi:hypothetical protein